MSDVTILREEGRPIGYLSRGVGSVGFSLLYDVPIREMLESVIDPTSYEVREEKGVVGTYVYYHSRISDALAPLNYIQVHPNGIHIGSDKEVAVDFLKGALRRLVPSAEMLPVSEWAISTESYMKYVAQLRLIIDENSIKELAHKTQKNPILLQPSDEILQFCMEKTGLKEIGGNIHLVLYPEFNESFAYPVNKQRSVICGFSLNDLEDSYEEIKRWCIARSLGYLTFGENFELNRKKYMEARILSDGVLAVYLNFYGSGSYPRGEEIKKINAPRHHPALEVLSEMWDKWTPYSAEMDEAIRRFWQNNFGTGLYFHGIRMPFGHRMAMSRAKRFIEEMK